MGSGWGGNREQQWTKVWAVSVLMVVGALGTQAPVPEGYHVPHHDVISVPIRRETFHPEESSSHQQTLRYFKAIKHARRRYSAWDDTPTSTENEFEGFLEFFAINNHHRRNPQDVPIPTPSAADAITPGSGGTAKIGTNVLSAIAPKTASSLGIDQDGLDFAYFAYIEFGPNRLKFKFIVDTGSSYTWVPSTACASAGCKAMKTYGTANSTSLKASTKTFSIIYGGGTVFGNVGNDTLRFAGFEVNAEFGLARSVSDKFVDFPIDGILGLGPKPEVGSSAYSDVATIMDTLAAQGAIKKKLYGIALARASDPVNDGVLNFGGIDTNMYEGDVTFTNTVAGSTLWHISLDAAAVGGKDLGLGSGRSVIVDTGTSLLFAPVEDAIKLHAAIPNAQVVGSTFIVPCDSTAAISLTFNNVSYSISPVDYIGPTISDGSYLCISLIKGRDLLGTNVWLLGDVFLKNVYSVFDLDLHRIGFANRKRAAGEPKPFTRTAWTSINAASLTPVASITSLLPAEETARVTTTASGTTATSGGDGTKKNGSKEEGSGEKSMGTRAGVVPGLWVMIMTVTFAWRVLGVLEI